MLDVSKQTSLDFLHHFSKWNSISKKLTNLRITAVPRWADVSPNQIADMFYPMAFQDTGTPARSILVPPQCRRAVEQTRSACGHPPFDKHLVSWGSVWKRFVINKQQNGSKSSFLRQESKREKTVLQLSLKYPLKIRHLRMSIRRFLPLSKGFTL